MKSLILRLRTRPFLVNLAQLSGATLAGGVIVIAVSPIITRLYSPTELGALGVYATTLGLVMVIAALRYDLAVPYPKEDREAARLLLVALITILGTTTIVAVLILAGIADFSPSLRTTLSRRLIWWLPVGMFMSAAYAAVSIWMVRRRDFVSLGRTKITQGTLQAASQVGLGLLKIGPSGLIIGQILGSSAGSLRLLREIRRRDKSAFEGISVRELVKTARAYKRFPLYSSPAVLLDALTGAMPLLFVAARFGSTAAGLLTLVQRVLVTPFGLLAVNLGQVVFGDMAALRRHDPQSLMAIFRRRVFQVLLIGLALLVPMLILVPLVLPKLFGKRWSEASIFFLILSPMTYATFVAAPFGFVIDVLRRQDLHLIRDLTRAVVMAIALALLVAFPAEWGWSLAVIALAGVLNSVFYLLISWYAIASHRKLLGATLSDNLDHNLFISAG